MLKKVRATTRGKVIFTLKLFRRALVRSEDKIFILDYIDRAEVKEKCSILKGFYKYLWYMNKKVLKKESEVVWKDSLASTLQMEAQA